MGRPWLSAGPDRKRADSAHTGAPSGRGGSCHKRRHSHRLWLQTERCQSGRTLSDRGSYTLTDSARDQMPARVSHSYSQNELLTSADVSCLLASRPPGGVMVEVFTPLTVLSSCVVQTHASAVDLKNRPVSVASRQKMGHLIMKL